MPRADDKPKLVKMAQAWDQLAAKADRASKKGRR